jgi:hypothetical protein
MSESCPPPGLWDDDEPEEPRYPHRPVEPPYGRTGETQPVHRTLDPQTDLDRLVRRWSLIATCWLAIAAVAGLRGVDLTSGLIVCLVWFLLQASRMR